MMFVTLISHFVVSHVVEVYVSICNSPGRGLGRKIDHLLGEGFNQLS